MVDRLRWRELVFAHRITFVKPPCVVRSLIGHIGKACERFLANEFYKSLKILQLVVKKPWTLCDSPVLNLITARQTDDIRPANDASWYISHLWLYWHIKQENQPVGGEVRNVTTLIPEQLSYIMLAITCSENVYACPCACGCTCMCDYARIIWK